MDDFFEELAPIGVDIDMDLTEMAAGMSSNSVDILSDPNFKYPAIVISGVHSEDTVNVLNSIRRDSYRLFDCWFDYNDGNTPEHSGTIQVDSKSLLTMRYLGLDVTLYLSEGNVRHLDLNDPYTIEQFI